MNLSFPPLSVHLGTVSGEFFPATVLLPAWPVWPPPVLDAATAGLLQTSSCGERQQGARSAPGRSDSESQRAPLMSLQNGSGRTCWQTGPKKTLLITESARRGHTDTLKRLKCGGVSPGSAYILISVHFIDVLFSFCKQKKLILSLSLLILKGRKELCY